MRGMKDLGDASYVIGIEIHRDRRNGVLGLSQRAYIDRILERYNMVQQWLTNKSFSCHAILTNQPLKFRIIKTDF